MKPGIKGILGGEIKSEKSEIPAWTRQSFEQAFFGKLESSL